MDNGIPAHYAEIPLPPRSWKGKLGRALLGIWRGIGKIPVLADILGVVIALGVSVIGLGEYLGSLLLLGFAALALASRLWHGDYPNVLKGIGTFFIVCGLLVCTLIIWDAKGDKPWSRLPHAWKRIASKEKGGATVAAPNATATPPKAAPPTKQESLTLMDLYNERPDTVSLDTTDIYLRAHGGEPHVPLKSAVVVDSPNQTYTLRFYISHSPYTYRVCKVLSNKNDNSYKYLRKMLAKNDSTLDPSYPLPPDFYTIRKPTFSGRVIIFHEDQLTKWEKATLDEEFRRNGMALELRGIEYLLMRNMMRDERSAYSSNTR